MNISDFMKRVLLILIDLLLATSANSLRISSPKNTFKDCSVDQSQWNSVDGYLLFQCNSAITIDLSAIIIRNSSSTQEFFFQDMEGMPRKYKYAKVPKLLLSGGSKRSSHIYEPWLAEVQRKTDAKFFFLTYIFDEEKDPLLNFFRGKAASKTSGTINTAKRALWLRNPCVDDVMLVYPLVEPGNPKQIGLTDSGFGSPTVDWYSLDEHISGDILDISVNNYFLVIAATRAIYASQDFRNHSLVYGGTQSSGKESFIKVYDIDSGCDSVVKSRLFTQQRCAAQFPNLSNLDMIIYQYTCSNEKFFVVMSNYLNGFRDWNDITKSLNITAPASAYSFNPGRGVVLVFTTDQSSGHSVATGKHIKNLSIIKTRRMLALDGCTLRNEPEITHAVYHRRSSILFMFGRKGVYQSLDYANTCTLMLTYRREDHVMNIYEEDQLGRIAAVTSNATILLGKSGVPRMVQIDSEILKKLNFEAALENTGVSFDLLSRSYVLTLNTDTATVSRNKIPMWPRVIQEVDVAFGHPMYVFFTSASSIFLYEHAPLNLSSDVTPVSGFTQEHLGLSLEQKGKTGQRMSGALFIEKIKLHKKPEVPGILSRITAFILRPFTYERHELDKIEINGYDPVTSRVQIIASDLKEAHIGMTIILPKISSFLLLSASNGSGVGLSITEVANSSRSGWLALDFSANAGQAKWKLGEDYCRHHMVQKFDNFMHSAHVVTDDNQDIVNEIYLWLTPPFTTMRNSPQLFLTSSNPYLHYLRVRRYVVIEVQPKEAVTVTARQITRQMGQTVITVYSRSMSLMCETTSLSVRINLDCPPTLFLHIMYPNTGEKNRGYLTALLEPPIVNNLPIVQPIPINYRPPSKYGRSLHLSPNVYNVNPETVRRLGYGSKQGNIKLDQCSKASTIEQCNCTTDRTASDFLQYSDCKKRAYTVRFPGKFVLALAIRKYDDPEKKDLPRITRDFLFTVNEVNERPVKLYYTDGKNVSTMLQEMENSANFPDAHSYYSSLRNLTVEFSGSGLYHLRIDSVPGISNCKFSTEIQLYVVVPALQYPVPALVIVVVIFVMLIILFLFIFYRIFKHGLILSNPSTGSYCRNTNMTYVKPKHSPAAYKAAIWYSGRIFDIIKSKTLPESSMNQERVVRVTTFDDATSSLGRASVGSLSSFPQRSSLRLPSTDRASISPRASFGSSPSR